MSDPSDIFQRAAGRSPAGASDAAEVARAARILALRGADLASEACPSAARARAENLFATARPRGLAERVQVLFDSWLSPATVALRGAEDEHHVCIQQGPVTADVETRTAEEGTHVMVALEGAPDGAVAWLLPSPAGDKVLVDLDLDEHATASTMLPVDATHVELEVFDGAHAILCSHRIPLRRES